MSPPSKSYHLHCLTIHSVQTYACVQTLTPTNCIQKITSLPCRCLKITSVPHCCTNHSMGLLLFLHYHLLSLSPLIHYFRLYLPLSRGPKLPCQDCSYEQHGVDGASRRCVRMDKLVRYHQLFSFSSPSDAVRSQTRYQSATTAPLLPASCQGVWLRKWNENNKDKSKQNARLPIPRTTTINN